MKSLTLTLFLALTITVAAKVWRNEDGSKSFQGDFVSFDGELVNIEMLNGKTVPLPLSRLHPEDQEWVRTFAKEKMAEEKKKAATALFAGLNFGDTKDLVLEKLKKSSIVESKLNEQLTGRSGLNGIFTTTNKIGPFHCTLFFDWDANGRLTEFTLHSDRVSADGYAGDLTECWNQMVHLMSEQFGKPKQAAPLPKITSLKEGMSMNTHLWRLKGSGTGMVGLGLENEKYIVTARFANE